MIDDTIRTAIAMQDAECYDDDIIEDEDIDLGGDDDDEEEGDGDW